VIVVDIGAMRQGPEESVHKLIGRFRPDVLFAFDPHPDFVEGVERSAGTFVVRRRAAAWIFDGLVPLVVDGICTGVDDKSRTYVSAFNLATFLRALPMKDTVLKIDAEGAEYKLTAWLADYDLDKELSLLLVEWHPPETSHGWYAERPTLRCPVEEWA
jgi:hypothetical protein